VQQQWLVQRLPRLPLLLLPQVRLLPEHWLLLLRLPELRLL
jgi:hypothetical protein